MTAYDEVPYDCQPIPCTAPEQLAMVSYVHGGPCPAVRDVRVLEIGCGNGANLLPQAFHRRESHFVGVDTSPVQIADARRSAQRLALSNVSFHAADVRDVADQLGVFDYIVVHGVLSWVSDDVRRGMLGLCREHLTARGLLYASYNTYPGWMPRGLVRDVLRRMGDARQPLRRQADDARRLARFLQQQATQFGHPYAVLLAHELDRIVEADDAYLIHEYLSEYNQAFWLRGFVSLAAEHGLRYVADASFNQPTVRVPDALRTAVEGYELAPLAAEELIDVLCYRQHRTSLFCRVDVAPQEQPGLSALDRTTIATGLQPVSAEPQLEAGVPESFAGYFDRDFEIELRDPLAKAALLVLAMRWPAGLTWERLWAKATDLLVGSGLTPPEHDGAERLQALLLELYTQGHADLRLREPLARMDVPAEPIASPLARYEAEHRGMVTSSGHQRLGLRTVDRQIVQRLDGQRSRKAIVTELAERLTAGEAMGLSEIEPASGNTSAIAEVEQWVGQQVDRIVGLLAMWGLLEEDRG